jgi:PAS domain S-box-containing protein
MRISDCHPLEAYRLVHDVGLPAATRAGSWQGENQLLGRDGQLIPVSQVILAHGQDSPYAYSTIARDLTRRKSIEKALREKQAFQDAIVASAGVCVIAVDIQGKIASFNRTAERLLGYTAQEVVGRMSPLALHVPEELAARAAELSQELGRAVEPKEVFTAKVLHGEAEAGEWTLVRKDGSTFAVQLTVTALKDAAGVLIGYLGVAHDLTASKAVENALRESERHLRIITESTEAWLVRIDMQERYLFANRAFNERIGMRRRTVIGRTMREVLGERGYKVLAPELARALAGERVLFEGHVHYYGMGERYARIEYIPERNEKGSVIGVVGVIVDLTQRRRAEEALRESEARLATLTAAVPAVLFSTTAEGRIDYVNDTFFEYSGLPRNVPLAPAWQQIVHPDDLPRVLTAWGESVRSGQEFIVECRVRRHDGMYRWFKAYAYHLRDPQRGAGKWLGVALDIDDQKKAEVELQDANRRKNEFLAMLAHELRNPLAPIRNSAHILHMLSVGEPRLKTTTEMIGRQVNHMARLIDDLLDVARITQGRITLRREPLELMPLLYSAVESVRPFIDARGHELRIEPPAQPIYLNADATRLTQVVSNLLSNAAKYTDAGGRIWLSARQEGEQAVVSVRDSGIGITLELLPHLFDPFTQSERTLDRAQGGLGIGLSLVKRLAEMHGGSVEVFSEGYGKGSTFTVRLPALPPEQMPHALPSFSLQVEGPASPLCLRVLVVDDNVDAEQSLSLLIRLEGHEVRAAHAGQEALQQARAFRPQVVLLDIGLPGMNGYDVARQLRSSPETADVVLVAITGYGQAEDREQALEAGFQHHLVKPVEPVALLELIEKLALADPSASARR